MPRESHASNSTQIKQQFLMIELIKLEALGDRIPPHKLTIQETLDFQKPWWHVRGKVMEETTEQEKTRGLKIISSKEDVN